VAEGARRITEEPTSAFDPEPPNTIDRFAAAKFEVSGNCDDVALGLNSGLKLMFSCGIKSQYEI
jgi:hypothetical protein